MNGQKLRRWQDSAGVYFPFTPLRNAAGNTVFTEADLVKLREGNPTLYQRRAEGGRVWPDNGREVGNVTPDMASRLRLDKPGPIVLDDAGIRHIEERHGDQIRGLGFGDARAFVNAVLANVSAVYDVDGGGRKYDLVSRAMTPQGRVMVRLEFDAAGDFYSVATAGPVRKTQYENKKPLWEGAHSTRFQTETPLATRRASQRGQSGELRQNTADVSTIAASGGDVNLASPRRHSLF